ncbi:hypothetical protein ABZZ36_44255 [Actinacidiphila glaucinigra]|uniref:hypothetical protein n=1 Tax=Actinacidiphila glaucinigra TaxID=235986 RepID=UPI0033AD4D6E
MSELTTVHPARRIEADEVTDNEREQAEAGFGRLLAQTEHAAALRGTLPLWARRAREVFTLGWALGVRYGHTGPAVSHTPVTDEEAAAALTPMSKRVGDGRAPDLGELVDYHGSLTSRHGRYWVTDIRGTISHGGAAYLGYRLSEMRDGRYVTIVSNVRRVSITPLGVFGTLEFDR